ncbi:MAG TPA: response regulator, partial [Usitatibacter sp.]|nr:response regulator [Usitatibacter sp.]
DALTVGLKREGFRVEVARDGAEALERFDSTNADIVLLDVMLPQVSGYDLLAAIRAREAWSGIPVIMLTARGQEKDIVKALDMGASDYMLKPFQPAELRARVRRLCPA